MSRHDRLIRPIVFLISRSLSCLGIFIVRICLVKLVVINACDLSPTKINSVNGCQAIVLKPYVSKTLIQVFSPMALEIRVNFQIRKLTNFWLYLRLYLHLLSYCLQCALKLCIGLIQSLVQVVPNVVD